MGFDYKLSYRRNLPHVQPAGATFFLTCRLAGSLPTSLIEQWNRERKWLAHLKQTNPAHYARVESEFERTWFAKFESVLDSGSCGPLWLRNERVADQLADSLHYRDGRVYRLDAYSIMPNHAHVVFKPLTLTQANNVTSRIEPSDPSRHIEGLQYNSLASIMQSLKGYTAFEANRILGREGEFWAHESYDHYVRDADEWRRIVAYVLNNPVKAGYVSKWREWKWNYHRE